MSDPAPETLRRLFPDHDPGELVASPHRAFLVARLLEEGDSADLRWLFATLGEAWVTRWIAEDGEGKLTARSAALWRLVLGVDAGAPELAPEIWPLASAGAP